MSTFIFKFRWYKDRENNDLTLFVPFLNKESIKHDNHVTLLATIYLRANTTHVFIFTTCYPIRHIQGNLKIQNIRITSQKFKRASTITQREQLSISTLDRTAHYSTPLIEDGNTLELFTLDLHCARIHRKKWDIAVKNIEILILAA
jgi:hypothetical protein